jgi:hypothetical protein
MRTRTFITIVVISILGLFSIGGCNTDSKERLAALQQGVTQLQARSAQADAAIASLQLFIAKAGPMLADANMTDGAVAKVKDLIAQAQSQIEDKLKYKAAVDATLADLQKELAAMPVAPDVSNEVGLVGSTLSSVGGQVGGDVGKWLALAGMVITFVSGLAPGLLKAKNAIGQANTATAKAAAATTALQEVVNGGEAFKEAVKTSESVTAESAIKAFKDAQAQAQQSQVTKELVAVARVAA